MRDSFGRSSGARLVSATNGAWTEDSGYRQARDLLKHGLPDAVFAANDLLALGVIRLFSERGIRTGNDVAVVGYDNTDIVSWTAVPITSVDQPRAEVGARSAACLIEQLENGFIGSGAKLKPTLEARMGTMGFARNSSRIDRGAE